MYHMILFKMMELRACQAYQILLNSIDNWKQTVSYNQPRGIPICIDIPIQNVLEILLLTYVIITISIAMFL